MITLYGDPRTKKNSMRAVVVRRAGGGSFTKLLPSQAYEVYERDCLDQLAAWVSLPIRTPVNVKCVYYMRTKRKVDLVNLLEATMDILVKAWVIEDDNCSIVVGHDGSRVLYDKNNPRVEIEIRSE